jgi:PAS domain S-box-containing protein
MGTSSNVVYVGSEVPPDVSSALGSVDVVSAVTDCETAIRDSKCVVVTDSLSDADCVELCVRIRQQRPNVPLIVFPTAGSERLAGEVVAAGADGYVPHEQGIDTLAERVAQLCTEPVSAAPPIDSPASGSSKRLELLVGQSPLAIIEWTLDFEVRRWNPAATVLFGYTVREARGKVGPEFLVPAADRDAVRRHWECLVDGSAADTSARQVNRNVRRDGRELTCEWVDMPLIDDDGSVVSVLSFAQNITDELQRAAALEALQETTQQLMRASSAEEIAALTIDATENVLDRSLAGIRIHDEDTERLEVAAMTSQLERYSEDVPAIGPGDGLLWETYESQTPTVIDDASTALIPYEIGREVGNAVAHPLGEHSLLTVGSRDGEDLDVAETHLVHVLAATTEAALDSAQRERVLERTKTIVETVGDGIYAADSDGRFVAVNDRLTSVTGYDREALLGEHFSMVVTDCSAERAYGRLGDLDSSEQGVTYEVTVVTSTGEHVPCEVITRPLADEEGLGGTVSIVRDISDRKRMERELADRRAKIESLHEVASRLDGCETPAAVYELTVAAAEDVLNFDVCVVDRAVGDYLEKAALSSHLDDADYVKRCHVEDGIAGKTYRNRRIYRLDAADRTDEGINETDTYASLLSAPLGEYGVFQAASTERGAFSADDEELAELLLSHVTDRLDQLASKGALEDERDRFIALFENVPDGVVSLRYLDDEPIVEAVNPAFEQLFGYAEGDLLGEPLNDALVPVDEAAEAAAINRRVSGGETVETEARRQTADGLREFIVRLVPIEVEGSITHAFGLYTDVTEQKQRQKRVEILNRVLRHDLRNGMNIVDGCAEMLGEAVDDEHAEYAAILQDQAADLIALAEKTRAAERTLDRPSGGPGPIDASAAVGRALAQLTAEFPCVDLARTVPPETFARADDYFELAVAQLLENAAEHHDRPSPSIAVTLEDRPADGMIALSVADDGPGIPDEERALFEAEREITQLRHASGLGLWVVDCIVTQLGGRLTFSQNEPRGTIVTIEIPRADPDIVRRAD